MIVKKFSADTENEAILLAQKELGNKAVVLNVKVLKQRGIFKLFKKDKVEVTAALEEDEFANKVRSEADDAGSNFDRTKTETKTFDAYAESLTSAKNSKKIDDIYSKGSHVDYSVSDKTGKVTDAKALEDKLDSLQSLLTGKFNKDELEFIKELDGDEADQEEVDFDKPKAKLKEKNAKNVRFLKMIYQKLVDNEVDAKYADELIGSIENSLKNESDLNSILAAVYQKIILKLGEPISIEKQDDDKKTRIIFFIGPTGVGKTTTIAKIASHIKLDEHKKIAFITSDTYRIAAVEQLNTYAAIIDSPVEVIYAADELKDACERLKAFDYILVDTAGRSHKASEQVDELKDFIDEAKKLEKDFSCDTYLVLSITTKYRDLKDIVERYKDIKDWSVIFTKLDETVSLGNILNIRILTGAPLSYTTSGQNVPEDIELIDEQSLARQLLGGD